MRSLVGAFCPVCLRDFADDLPPCFTEVLLAAALLVDCGGDFAGVFLLLAEPGWWLFDVGPEAVGFFFVALPDAASDWPNLAGTPGPANAEVSTTRSAGRRTLISFGVPSI